MVFVIYCWGSAAYHKQALLAAKSILARSDSARILLFASDPSLFRGDRIEVIPITKFDWANWIGLLGYIHRIKIQVMMKSLLNINDSQAICYVDADMYCYNIPEEIVAPIGKVYMWSYEGRVSESFFPKLHKFLGANRELLTENGFPDLSPDLMMYNSGLICMPPVSSRMKALNKVLNLTDLLCLHFPQQMNWHEQVSFSHVLPKLSEFGTMSKGFEHYWSLKSEVGDLLDKMSLSEIEELAQSKHKFDALCNKAASIQGTLLNKARLFSMRQLRSIRKRISLSKAKYYTSS